MRWSNWRVIGKRLKRWQKVVVCIAAIAVAIVLGCSFFRISRLQDIEAYQGMALECHPIWKQFAWRRYGRGDPANELLHRFPPTRRDEFDRFGIYRYHGGTSNDLAFTGFTVVARDGRLISAGAWSCTWRFTFFTTQDPDLDTKYREYTDNRRRSILRKRLDGWYAQLTEFHTQYLRWPTNENEFACFVTLPRCLTADDLDLVYTQDAHAIEIAIKELPGEKRTIPNPP